jgi:hypothetical protein
MERGIDIARFKRDCVAFLKMFNRVTFDRD